MDSVLLLHYLSLQHFTATVISLTYVKLGFYFSCSERSYTYLHHTPCKYCWTKHNHWVWKVNINNTGCFQLRYIHIYRAQGFLQTAIHVLCADQYSEIFISFYQHVAELHLLTQLHWSQSTLIPPFSVIRYAFLASSQEVRLDGKFTLLILVAL